MSTYSPPEDVRLHRCRDRHKRLRLHEWARAAGTSNTVGCATQRYPGRGMELAPCSGAPALVVSVESILGGNGA